MSDNTTLLPVSQNAQDNDKSKLRFLPVMQNTQVNDMSKFCIPYGANLIILSIANASIFE